MINISDGGLLPALLCAGLGWGIAYVTLSARYKEELRDCKKKLSEKLHSMEKRLSAAQEKLSEKENVVVVLQRDITSHKHELARLQKQIDAQVGKTIAIYGKNHSVATTESLPPLCDEQRRILDAVLRGGNFFIQGRAGTGKSTLLSYLRRELEAKGRGVLVVSFTAMAAVNVSGCTIHSLFRFPRMDFFDVPKMKPPSALRVSLHPSRVHTLIVDEVSMVRPDMLDAMDKYARWARGCNDKPFGGLQVVLVGDVLQLPPIIKKSGSFLKTYGFAKPYFFDAHAYQTGGFMPVLLKQAHRQQDSQLWQQLGVIRTAYQKDGVLSHADGVLSHALQYFNSLKITDTTERNDSIQLTATRAEADRTNFAKLNGLPGAHCSYPCVIKGKFGLGEDDDKRYPAPLVLQLKVGALVLVLKNLHYPDCLNGSQGVVRDIQDDAVKVYMLEYRTEHTLQRETWEYEEYNSVGEPEVVGTFTQFPLQLGYAMTIHKAQGKTLRKVRVSLSNAFTTGQAYVALSRTRHAADMHVENLTADSVLVDERVVSWLKGQKWMQL